MKTTAPATLLGDDYLSTISLMLNRTPASVLGDHLNIVATLNGKQTCIWAQHCLFRLICPGGKCSIADTFNRNIQKNLLPCPLVHNTEDEFCNLAPLRRHTMSLCNCTDGHVCLFAALSSVEYLFTKKSPFLLRLSMATVNGALATSRAIEISLSQRPDILQKIIGEIEEKLVS